MGLGSRTVCLFAGKGWQRTPLLGPSFEAQSICYRVKGKVASWQQKEGLGQGTGVCAREAEPRHCYQPERRNPFS